MELDEPATASPWWWTVPILALAGLVHLAWFPFIERQFIGNGGLWLLIVGLTFLSIGVLLRKVAMTPRELAILTLGFVLDWILFSPSIFYGAVGHDRVPRPHSRVVLEIVSMVMVLVPLWVVIAFVLLRGKRWTAIVFGVIQAWMALIIAFLDAGLINNAWL